MEAVPHAVVSRNPRRSSRRATLAAVAVALACASLARAQDEDADAPDEGGGRPWEAYFVGYESEPGMLASGRVLASIQRGASRGFAALADEKPKLAPVWEFPLAAALFLVEHEIGGHGGRAREFDLGPHYGFGYDLSAYTTVDRNPRTNFESAEVAAGGFEATGVLGHRLLLDLYRAGGAEASTVPLLLLAKTDFSLYVQQIDSPGNPDSFVEQLHSGYDPVIYLAARQAARVGADPEDFWNELYDVDFADPLLDRNYDDLREAAIWNALDPALVAAVWSYFGAHLGDGKARIEPLALRLGAGDLALTVGTRAYLSPTWVSKVLDLHLRTPVALVTVWVRQLEGSIDSAYGWGASVHGLELGPLAFHLEGEIWDEPQGPEGPTPVDGWNASAELDWEIAGGIGVSLRFGRKEAGVLPGLPVDEGTYAGFGLLVAR